MIQTTTSAGIAQNPLLSAALSNEQGNCLMATFMGWTSNKAKHFKVPNKIEFQFDASDGYIMKHSSNLDFHKYWNWMMPVWYKFRDLKFDEETKNKLHTNYVARLAQDLAYGTLAEFHHNIQIAIKWYNQQGVSKR